MTATGIREQETPLPLDRKRKQNRELGVGSRQHRQKQGCPAGGAGRCASSVTALLRSDHAAVSFRVVLYNALKLMRLH